MRREGDSYMISQQTGRYLFKTMRSVLADRNSPANKANDTAQYITRYVENPNAKAPFKYAGDLSDPQIFVDAFAHRAAYLTATALRKRDIEKRTWNDLLIDIFRMSCVSLSLSLVVASTAFSSLRELTLSSFSCLAGPRTRSSSSSTTLRRPSCTTRSWRASRPCTAS